MEVSHPSAGKTVDLRPLLAQLPAQKTQELINTPHATTTYYQELSCLNHV